MTVSNTPPLPPFSSFLLFIMDCVTALLSFLPLPVQAVVSSFMIGGLFGLMLPSVLIVHSAVSSARSSLAPLLPSPLSDYYFTTCYLTLLTVYSLGNLVDNHATNPHKNLSRRLPNVNPPISWIEARSQSFWLSHFSYFPTSVVAPPSLSFSRDKQYVFAVHPHGIHCWTLNCLAFPESPFDSRFGVVSEGRMTGLAASVIFRIPVVRELFLSMGYVDASRSVANKVLEKVRTAGKCPVCSPRRSPLQTSGPSTRPTFRVLAPTTKFLLSLVKTPHAHARALGKESAPLRRVAFSSSSLAA